jgi:hypothetical protein
MQVAEFFEVGRSGKALAGFCHLCRR